jgi:hypothetical protein
MPSAKATAGCCNDLRYNRSDRWLGRIPGSAGSRAVPHERNVPAGAQGGPQGRGVFRGNGIFRHSGRRDPQDEQLVLGVVALALIVDVAVVVDWIKAIVARRT